MDANRQLQVIPLQANHAHSALSADYGEPLVEQETIYPQPRFNNRITSMKVVRNVTQPTLTAYLPHPVVATGAAAIICPGGGFIFLAMEIEGPAAAQWLAAHGIAAFVLKYRLLPTAIDDGEFLNHSPRPDVTQMKTQSQQAVADGLEGLRVVRERAAEWGIDSRKIGILGFSAGGVVATGVAVQSQPENRPNFVALLYSPVWHDFTPQADALPLFLAFASDDPVLSMLSEGNIRLYTLWKDAGHPVELHVYSKGGHGFGMAQQGFPSDHWIDRFWDWLNIQGFLANPD